MKRILIADDNASVRRGLRGVIRDHHDWDVCGEAVAIGYTILPLQPACGQRQSRSGVFSIASHSTLQYLLPSAAVQLQGGCAHFLFCAAISPPSSRSISANTTFAEEIDLFSKSPEWCCQ